MHKNLTVIKIVLFVVISTLPTIGFLSQPISIKTDIMALLPQSKENDLKQIAFNHVSSESMGRINILFGDKDAESSKNAGLYFKSLIEGIVANISYEINADDHKAMLAGLSSYTYHLLPDSYRTLLKNKEYGEIVNNSLAMIYSPVSANIAGFQKDPFMLLGYYMLENNFLKSGFYPEKSVLVSDYDNTTFSFMTIKLAKDSVFSPSKLSKIIQSLDNAKKLTMARYKNVTINITGIPVHTQKVSSASMREINIISIISFVVILFVFIAGLRTFKGFIITAISIGFGFCMAFFVTISIFHEIHILTLTFGTSLIGLSVDYCLHYIVERSSTNSNDALQRIISAATISMITSIVGFAFLLISDMSLLNQMAVFSIAGLVYVYLILVVFYPIVFRHMRLKTVSYYAIHIESKIIKSLTPLFMRQTRFKLIIFTMVVAICVSQLGVNDSIRNLYEPNAELMQREILFSNISRQNLSLQYFFITGDSDEDILQHEENLRQYLDQEIVNGTLTGYKAISQLVPSIRKQQENYRLSAELFTAGIDTLRNTIGIDTDQFHTDFIKQQDDYLTIDKILSYKQLEILNTFWVAGKGTVVMLEGVKDVSALAQYSSDNVLFLDKLNEFTDILTIYRHKSMISLVVAYTLIVLFMFVRYGIRSGAAVVMPPTLAIATLLSLFGCIGVQISFFHVIGLFLVLCFGLDYSIFRIETANKLCFSGIAVMFSCITTLASFGMMAFTSFNVTSALGVTIFGGIFLAYFFSPIAGFFDNNRR